MSQVGDQLAAVRDRIFTLAQAQLQRHHVVLDLNAGNGLLTWEALRCVPTATTERLTYAQRLTRLLKEAEVRAVQDFFTRSLLHQTVTWLNTIAFVQARL